MQTRDKVVVEGVPGTWTTNLSDEDVRAFYKQHHGKQVEATDMKIGVFDRIAIIRYGDWVVPFKDGTCRWALLNEQNWVTYRTSYEWEIWSARNQEIAELKDEQEQERAAVGLLLRTENEYLKREAREAAKVSDWAAAERHLLKRADLVAEIERHNIQNWWSHLILEDFRRSFSHFPSSRPGIAFITKYDCRAAMFFDFATHWAFGYRRPNAAREAEIEKIFDAATELFPKDGGLYKQACLLLRRLKRLDLAIKFCQIAIQRGVNDDTKSGFVGRLKRLQREQPQTLSTATE